MPAITKTATNVQMLNIPGSPGPVPPRHHRATKTVEAIISHVPGRPGIMVTNQTAFTMHRSTAQT
jgi:hypothetical protein